MYFLRRNKQFQRLLRSSADIDCLQGSSDRQLHGNRKSAQYRSLREQAKAKQEKAMQKDREGEDLDAN